MRRYQIGSAEQNTTNFEVMAQVNKAATKYLDRSKGIQVGRFYTIPALTHEYAA